MGAVCAGVEGKITKSNEEFGKEFVFEFSGSDFFSFSVVWSVVWKTLVEVSAEISVDCSGS